MKRILVMASLFALSLSGLGQNLQHFAVPPQYRDKKVLSHLENLQNHIKALRKSELKASFFGWSNGDVGAAAEQAVGKQLQSIQMTISKIEDIQSAGQYSVHDLFIVYATSSGIIETAGSLAQNLWTYKKEAELSAEILSDISEVTLSLVDLEKDALLVIDLQGDMLMTFESQPPCKAEMKEQ